MSGGFAGWRGAGGFTAHAVNPAPRPGPAAGGCAFNRMRGRAQQAMRLHPCRLVSAIHGAQRSRKPTRAPPQQTPGVPAKTVEPRHAWLRFHRADALEGVECGSVMNEGRGREGYGREMEQRRLAPEPRAVAVASLSADPRSACSPFSPHPAATAPPRSTAVAKRAANCQGAVRVGWRDRRVPWMAHASLHGRIHGVSRQPTRTDPARQNTRTGSAQLTLTRNVAKKNTTLKESAQSPQRSGRHCRRSRTDARSRANSGSIRDGRNRCPTYRTARQRAASPASSHRSRPTSA